MTDLVRLTNMVEAIGDTCADVTRLCGCVRQELTDDAPDVAVADLKRALALVRRATTLGNVLANVLDAIDTEEIAEGNIEAAREAVGA